MAGITFYDAYFPMLIAATDALEAILVKSQAHAKEHGVDVDADYVPLRLYEDMKPFSFQISIVCNFAGRCVNRLTGDTPDAWEEGEGATFDQLLARVRKTAELLKSARPEDINGKESTVIEVSLGPKTKKMECKDYVTLMILPNVFFHVQTTYALMRMKGVPLGKMDFLVPFMGAHLN
ncbi:hypothetical protein VSDG_04973 [Cytospora chrysosperma]|uniref:DUF1993 domain-containing protein n=1 Tax=Cytospora chrysosperma TaxID=252740 RepID=A0A423VYR4_CYTCH|nr:hypothetical protein VSDG_04973 [Valsa sordida]